MLFENVELDTLLFEQAYDFLLKDKNVSKELIDKHLKPEEKRSKPNTINKIYKSLLESAQNLQMSPKK
jgi:hypothetical protein